MCANAEANASEDGSFAEMRVDWALAGQCAKKDALAQAVGVCSNTVAQSGKRVEAAQGLEQRRRGKLKEKAGSALDDEQAMRLA